MSFLQFFRNSRPVISDIISHTTGNGSLIISRSFPLFLLIFLLLTTCFFRSRLSNHLSVWTVFWLLTDLHISASAVILKNANNKVSKLSKVGDRSRGRPEGSFFNSFYTEVLGRALLLSLDCSTLPSIRTLYCWVLSKEVSSTIFKVFGMTWPGIEHRSPGPLVNNLPTGGARGVMVIIVGNGHGDTSSNPRRDWLHFT